MRLKIYFGGASPNCGVDVRLNIIQQSTLAHKNPTPFRRGSMSNIKEIAKMAGLIEQCTSTKQPKYELISSHTARRTGATLMYLAGVDAYDICSITGHSSIKMLNKYIKAKELEVAKKLISRYKYFD